MGNLRLRRIDNLPEVSQLVHGRQNLVSHPGVPYFSVHALMQTQQAALLRPKNLRTGFGVGSVSMIKVG